MRDKVTMGFYRDTESRQVFALRRVNGEVVGYVATKPSERVPLNLPLLDLEHDPTTCRVLTERCQSLRLLPWKRFDDEETVELRAEWQERLG